MAHHPSLHPIIGARRVDQLVDNLAASDLVLPQEVVSRLDEVSAIERGFPLDMIDSSRDFVYGAVAERVAQR